MLRLDGGVIAALVASVVVLAAPGARADSESSPRRVQVMLVGRGQEDPSLYGRIRSLFDPETRVELGSVPSLDSSAVLDPARPDTVYLWIALRSDARARVYVATREESATSARYLFREVELPTGLDEVGAETLAQIAHSSATALWAREQQTPKGQVAAELARDAPRPSPAAPALPPPSPPAPPRSSRSVGPAGVGLGLAVGASYGIHRSGVEGWLQEPGGFMELSYRSRLALRVGAGYLVPARFEATPARVHLKGASGEARIGWTTAAAGRPRARVEAGVGALFVRWTASAEPPASAGRGPGDQRGYAVGSAGGELPLGPVWLGARLELRVPFRQTSYDVLIGEQRRTVGTAWLSPGAYLEVGVPLTRFGRD